MNYFFVCSAAHATNYRQASMGNAYKDLTTESSFDGYLVKPYSIGDLNAAILGHDF